MTRYNLPQRRKSRQLTRRLTNDRMLRAVIAVLVCTVSGLTFVTSYSGIRGLGNEHGLSGADAVLLLLSADGLITIASLVLLHEALSGRAAPGLARALLWLGTTTTATADITYAARYGLVGTVISAWPMVALPGMVEMVMQVVRQARPERVMATEPLGTASAEGVTALSPEPADKREAELIAAGIRIREQAERDGVRLSSKTFADRIRENGYTIANGRLRWLRAACGFPPSEACGREAAKLR
jgi:hypothetical protein